MNTTNRTASSFDRSNKPAQTNPSPAASFARREPRERDFGIGYGNSSGYVSHRRYASHWGAPRFRCA